MGIGRGVVVKSQRRNFVVFPLLGISGSDFSTLDLVSVLASLLFMVEAEKKKEVVRPNLKALRGYAAPAVASGLRFDSGDCDSLSRGGRFAVPRSALLLCAT